MVLVGHRVRPPRCGHRDERETSTLERAKAEFQRSWAAVRAAASV